MEALRVGGIVSGLDTNAIVDSMVASAMIPVDRLNQKSKYLAMEQTAYNTVIDAMTDLKDSLFPLKLESTFKSKTVSVANSNILSATASTDTKPGVYNVDVEQLAANSFATSFVAKPSFFQGANMGTGVISTDTTFDYQLEGVHSVTVGGTTSLSTPITSFLPGANFNSGSILASPAFDYQLKGSHSVTVDEVNPTLSVATDEFTAADGRSFEKFLGGAVSSVDAEGKYTPALNTINGKSLVLDIQLGTATSTPVTVNFAGYTAPLSIQEIAKDIEDQLNVGLGTTQYDQKIAVKIEHDGTNHKLAFYNTDGTQNMTIQLGAGSDATLANNLGLPTAGTPLTSSGRVPKMTNNVAATTLANLTTQMTIPGGGIIPGFTLGLVPSTTTPPTPAVVKEGTFNVNYDTTVKIATDEFKAADGRRFEKFLNSSMTGVDASGKYDRPLSDINGKQIDFEIKIDGVTKTIPINFAGYTDPLFIQEIAKDIEDQLNVGLGTTKYDQKMAVKTEYDPATGEHKLAFYNSNGKDNMDIKIVSGNATLAGQLGLPAIGTPLTSNGRVEKMIQHVTSGTLEVLTNQMTIPKGGIVPGIKLKLSEGQTSVKPGTFGVLYDASVNRKLGSESQVLGNNFNKIENPTGTPPDQSDIDDWLGNYFTTASGSLFDNPAVPDDLNGFFHINDFKIEIPDISLLTPNSLMGLINSSGAGVVASWDYENNFFKLERNTEGPNDIRLGATGDTSDILDFMKLSLPAGAIHIRGSDKGTVDLQAPIKESGITTLIEPARGIFTINGVSIFLDTTKDTVEDVIRKVNSSGAGVVMSYDKELDKFRLDSDDNVSQIKVGSPRDTSNFLDAIGLTDSYQDEETVGTPGQNNIFKIDGIKYERKSNEVEGIIPGLSMTLTDVGMTTLTVDLDTDRAVNAVAEFAVQYNELMLMLSPEGYTKEEREKYWEPLSDARRKEMSKEDIETYDKNHNEMRNRETIRRSSELKHLKTNLRTTLTSNVNTTSKFDNITEIGLNIAGGDAGDWTTTTKGLFIDASTDVEKITEIIKAGDFVKTLKSDTDEVLKFFNENETVSDKVVSEGWGTRYDTWATDNSNTSSVLYKKAGPNGSIENQLDRLQEQIKTQSDRVESYLERLWQSFTDMEIKMQQIQAQSAELAKIGQ